MNNTFAFTRLSVAIVAALSQSVWAEQEVQRPIMEETLIVGKSVAYANTAILEEMVKQQSAMTSVLAVIDNLPGVLVSEGDTFGSDDWSTSISIRGFQSNLDEQQIGITVDGLSNGNSNYGGGAKANRFIDTENLRGVTVSQGTADIASRSNEALGGTLDFTTIDPGEEEKLIVSFTTGDFDAQKLYARYETGEFLSDTYAWLSVSTTESSDFMDQVAQQSRDHFAAKLISNQANVQWTGYFSYDDAHEDNYQRVSLEEFKQNPDWDRLTAEWTGIPYVDQLYRRGWSTLRTNAFAYLKADFSIGDVDISTNVYHHHNTGRGDWVPQYIVDVTADASGNSELVSGVTAVGGAPLGTIYFVDASGNALSPSAGCVSSITFPYGGSGPEADPACYSDSAIPVGSYRHTHYEKNRQGINADFAWNLQLGEIDNNLRGGFWYEDYKREESRDWHKVIDSRTAYYFDNTPYWIQYDREYPVETTMMYLEDAVAVGPVAARLGVKQFLVDLERKDSISGSSRSVNSDSDLLLSGGVVVQLPVDGLEVFAGYAENFAAIKDEVLEADATALQSVEPETAENIDIGLRFNTSKLSLGVTLYEITFDNRITFIPPGSTLGNNYLIGANGSYENVGGVDSSGIEASLRYQINDALSVYTSYTNNEAEYSGANPDYAKGNTVFGSVEEMAVVSFDLNRDLFNAGFSTKYVGGRWLDPANTQRLDGYIVSDFYVGKEIQMSGEVKSVQLNMTINNVFNESYIGGVAGGWGGWIGAPRTAALNIQAVF